MHSNDPVILLQYIKFHQHLSRMYVEERESVCVCVYARMHTHVPAHMLTQVLMQLGCE